MGDEPIHTRAGSGDTRARILATARDLFVEYGYQRTSLRQIAERLGLTKAAILYHFPSKAHILATLAEPLLDDIESIVDEAATLEPARARWAVVEGWLDVMLAHRHSLRMLTHDLALVAQQPAFPRFIHVAERAHRLIAGPSAGARERIRAVQATSMIGDPVFFVGDLPAEQLRAEILDGIRRLMSHVPDPPPRGGRPRRGAGRPPAMSHEMVAEAQRMRAEGGHTVEQIAAALGVSRATLYRHLRAPDGAPR